MQARGRGERRRVLQRIKRHQDGVEIVEDLAGECDQLVEARIERADAYSRPRFDQNDVAVRDAALREGHAAIRCRVAPRHSALRLGGEWQVVLERWQHRFRWHHDVSTMEPAAARRPDFQATV